MNKTEKFLKDLKSGKLETDPGFVADVLENEIPFESASRFASTEFSVSVGALIENVRKKLLDVEPRHVLAEIVESYMTPEEADGFVEFHWAWYRDDLEENGNRT